MAERADGATIDPDSKRQGEFFAILCAAAVDPTRTPPPNRREEKKERNIATANLGPLDLELAEREKVDFALSCGLVSPASTPDTLLAVIRAETSILQYFLSAGLPMSHCSGLTLYSTFSYQ